MWWVWSKVCRVWVGSIWLETLCSIVGVHQLLDRAKSRHPEIEKNDTYTYVHANRILKQ